MLLCTQTERVFRTIGPEQGTSILAEAGYDLLDLSLFDMTQEASPWNQDGYRDLAKQYRALAEQHQIRYYQAHAPFASAIEGDEEYNRMMFDRIVRSMEIASIAGCECIVVHPVAFQDKEEQGRWNEDFYRRLLPFAEEYSITILTENMFGRDPKRGYIVANVLSFGEDLARFVDTINHPRLGICLDLGHSGLVGQDADVAIRAIGRDRLTALHVHDNDFVADRHTLPGLGKLDWDAICTALGEIDYQGVFTLEADNFFSGFSPENYLDCAKFMATIARSLMAKVEAAR